MPPVLQCTRLRARLLQGDSNADDGDDGDYDDGDDGDDGDYDDGDVYEYLTNYTCNADDGDDGDYDDGDEDGDDLFSLAASNPQTSLCTTLGHTWPEALPCTT